MSNTKDVIIEGRVPYDWLNAYPENAVTDDDRAFMCRMFMGSVTGLSLSYVFDGYEPTGTGGRYHMDRVIINGQEALHYEALARMVEIIAKAGTVTKQLVRDLDDRGTWGRIPTAAECAESQRRAREQVDEMMRGHHWVTVETARGSESHLEPD